MSTIHTLNNVSNRILKTFNGLDNYCIGQFTNNNFYPINTKVIISTFNQIPNICISQFAISILETQRQAVAAFQALIDSLFYINTVQIFTKFDLILDDEPFHIELVTGANASQAPPNLIETAIENAYYNIDKFKNSKLIIMIKSKCPAFIETLVFETLKYIIYKLLGM